MFERDLGWHRGIGKRARSAAEGFVHEGLRDLRDLGVGTLIIYESGGVDEFLRPIEALTKRLHEVLCLEGEDREMAGFLRQYVADFGKDGLGEVGGKVERPLFGFDDDEIRCFSWIETRGVN